MAADILVEKIFHSALPIFVESRVPPLPRSRALVVNANAYDYCGRQFGLCSENVPSQLNRFSGKATGSFL
jgi:hypothetical protein